MGGSIFTLTLILSLLVYYFFILLGYHDNLGIGEALLGDPSESSDIMLLNQEILTVTIVYS